ncbi:oxidoreductase [Luteimicrobium album]|uniref:Oxidoreductase n=1 Tax=Luteimicrobium album TaxID=1054550 RepID=A0ABQ6HXT3_9MICO|nr:L-glyceraldehyde 3-phosphate reductase [Luteimicrobium album]GMA23320.1 oxidoreductase [Luteimicrobium album]
MLYRNVGRSGLVLPVLSLGLWHNFGHDVTFERQRAVARRAFEHGMVHLDLANNYGPPPGSAEESLGQLLRTDLRGHRDELVISTKAGWDMWDGVYGGPSGSRKHLLASLDQSLGRMGLDYVDIFYSHRPDASTPLEETAGALHTAVTSGRALYVGISSYGPEQTRQIAAMLSDLGTPLLIHQPSYSMLNRWVDKDGLLDVTAELGVGVIGFSALAQGMLTDKYLDGIPEGSRATQSKSLAPALLAPETVQNLRGLAELARGRGQSLAQLALAWGLRDERVTSLVIGASRPEQLDQNVLALEDLSFTSAELAEIDRLAVDAGIDLWRDARLTGR